MWIVVDGIEGSGKSSLIARFAEDFDVIKVFEPGFTKYGQSIRQLLLFDNQGDMHPTTEALLFMADRKETYSKVILPALSEGKMVISDRSFTSTFAYQVTAQGLRNDDYIKMLDILHFDEPDLIVIIDIPVSLARERIKGKKLDRFEKMPDSFHEKVKHGYLALADLVIDGDKPFDDVYAEFKHELSIRGAEKWKKF